MRRIEASVSPDPFIQMDTRIVECLYGQILLLKYSIYIQTFTIKVIHCISTLLNKLSCFVQ